MQPTRGWKGKKSLFSLVGGILIHITLGTVYTYANMAPYIISYFRRHSHPRGLKVSDAPWVFACAAVGQSLFMYFGGLLAQRYSVRLASALGCFMLTAGVLLSAVTIRVSYYLFLLTYGVMFGIGAGLAYVAPLYCVIRWFPSCKGLVNGIVLAGYGGGAVVFSYVQTGFLNPSDIHPATIDPDMPSEKYFTNDKLLRRVPHMFLILGAIYAVLQIIGCLMLFEPKMKKMKKNRGGQLTEEDCTLIPPDSPTAIDVAASADEGYSAIPIDYSHNSMKSEAPSNTSMLESMGYCNQAMLPDETQQLAIGGVQSKYLLINSSCEQVLARETLRSTDPSTPADRSMMNSVEVPSPQQKMDLISLRPVELLRETNFYVLWCMFLVNTQVVVFFSSVYKLFGEMFIDDDHFLTIVASTSALFNAGGRIFWGYLSDRVSCKFALVCMSALATCLMATFYLSSVADSRPMYFLWVCAIYLCIGGNYSLFPTAACQCFGPGHMAANYGLLFTSQAVSGVTGAVLSTTLSSKVGWSYSFITTAGFSLIGFVLALVLREKKILRIPAS